MEDEKSLITIFFSFVFILGLILVFPSKTNELFNQTFYIVSGAVIFILIFFYFWLRFNRY